ncbi:tRNA-intron endonuclease [Natronoarchaeum philippinense]|uniref:tRNA-splicing endonuclease n=1 Tax=Natronoarchaeum philippinense TaxID=558529 RepID=A0A285P8Q2_NATPI|nr:tRNA-intron lyase [Natronoarchaeum philippinense]SNZ17583.1 tRNA-intron endonuclease [Natronoarchaeum philippinense]
MHGHRRDGVVRVAEDARQRFYDARGYGYPLSGNEIALAPVEAAHLLFRGDLDAVDGDGFREFFAGADDAGFGLRFLVYADLRARGFYLSPASEEWVPDAVDTDDIDFVVYPRGKDRHDGEVAYRIRVVGERDRVAASSLGECTLAIVDEESEITYFQTTDPDISGSTTVDLPDGVPTALFDDRAICWEPPEELHQSGFYGQPLAGREPADEQGLQLSLVEAAQLAAAGAIDVPGGYDAVVERGRAVEGERFDRRLRTYAVLRDRGVVPKTGFKFGADFRTYADVESVEELSHSERLVRVLPPGYAFSPRDLSLDVRLAHGVRKEMVFALPDGEDVAWLGVERITP